MQKKISVATTICPIYYIFILTGSLDPDNAKQ